MQRLTVWALVLALWFAPAWAQTPKEQEPPEEDETLTPREYSFNPLQAEKEVQVGKFYFKKRSYRAAAQRFREATKWNEGLAEAYLRLGESLERLKDFTGARDAYQKYVEIEKDDRKTEDIRKKLSKLASNERK